MRRVAIAIVVVVVASATVARAQSLPLLSRQTTFSPQLFHVAPGPDAYITVEGVAPLHHLSVGAGAYVDYARDPFNILTYSSRTGDPYGAEVQAQAHVLAATVWLGLGLWERLQIALALPMTLYQTGNSYDSDLPQPDGVQVRPPSGFALGDLRLYLKAKIWGKSRGFQLGVSHWLSAPLGDDSRLGGEQHFDGFAGEPRLLAEWIGGAANATWRVALNVGFLWRVHSSFYYTDGAGQQLTYAAAFAIDLARGRVGLIAEVYGHHDFADGDYTAESPLELDVAARYRLAHGFAITAGVGTGVVQGAGAPWPRVFAGASYATQMRDRDGDGIPDNRDRCPDDAEDKDGFQDDDGCPERDNDGDTIPDDKDRCPNQAEDFDQFEDNDGCPDPDNDRDGIPDIKDACPNDAEDHKPPKPDDGCPLGKTDSDGDGIPDSLDKCPNEPEDKDGFEDSDGCPDPDNDNDGVPDSFDECPNQPEDADGVDDEDGCPDAGVSGVHIKDKEVVTKEPLAVEHGRLTAASQRALDGVAQLLKARPKIALRIDGNWSESLGEDKGVALSNALTDEVRRTLIKRGVAPDRLTPSGHAVADDDPDPRIRLIIVAP